MSIVPDADAHYAQAKGAGAKIVLDIVDASYGGRGYSCRDLEGHLGASGRIILGRRGRTDRSDFKPRIPGGSEILSAAPSGRCVFRLSPGVKTPG